jgi:hypothetical protein
MFNSATLAEKASTILIEKTERRLEALLAQHGVSDPGELPRALQSQLLQSAIFETAAATFPSGNLEMLKHGFQSFAHPAFLDAMDRMRVSCRSPSDAFEMTRGMYAAVVLAGYGLPVAPFDLNRPRILAKPTNDIDAVLDLFSSDKGAYVGYSSCDAPFYLLVTDCIRSMRRLVTTHPRASELKDLFARTDEPLPPDPELAFMPGMAIFGRQAGDMISTVCLLDPDPMAGSITLYAGWQVDGEPFGAPNDGYVPVPGQLLRAVVDDPKVAYSFWHTARVPKSIH